MKNEYLFEKPTRHFFNAAMSIIQQIITPTVNYE